MASDETSSCSQTLAVVGMPFITVIVPVRNEAAFLGNTLEQLIAQDYDSDRYEILVVDGCSTDDTRSIAQSFHSRFANLQVLDNPARLSSAARNVGIRHAQGEYILIVDGHCEIDRKSYLKNVAEAFDRSGADCLGRPQPLDIAEASLLQQAIAAARSSWLGHHPASFIYADAEQFTPAKSVAVAYRREVFNQVGLFDESFDACEDVELNHRIDRAGLRCYFSPKIAAHYVPRSSLSALFSQMSRYGRGRVRLLRKHPETFSFSSFAPALLLGGVLGGPLTGLAWTPLWSIYLGVLTAYLVLVLLAAVHVSLHHRRPSYLAWVPLVYMTVHSGTGWGILSEVLRFPPRRGAIQ